MEWITTSTIIQDLRSEREGGAWNTLVQRFQAPIVSFARRAGLPPADCEDVAQETLLAFVEALRAGRYDAERGRLNRWLFGIAYRQLKRHQQRAARAPVNVQGSTGDGTFWGALPDEDQATTEWDRQWEQSVLDQCLEQVRREVEPTTFRAFELVVGGDCSANEAASALGVPVKTVYNAKHRVLRRVRELREQFEKVDEHSM